MSHDSGMTPPHLPHRHHRPHLITITGSNAQGRQDVCMCVNTRLSVAVFVRFLERKVWGKTRTSASGGDEESLRHEPTCVCVQVWQRRHVSKRRTPGFSPELTFHLASSKERIHTYTYSKYVDSYSTLNTVISRALRHHLCAFPSWRCIRFFRSLCVLCDTDAE